MRAMLLDAPRTPLRLVDIASPVAGAGEVVVRVRACGVCRTDLHVVDGDLPPLRLPIVPGHEIVGVVTQKGSGVDDIDIGDRVGVPWLAQTCGRCDYCQRGRENLCDAPQFTGYSVNGGYAEQAVADARYCFKLPDRFTDLELAPWLCAGLIGLRALRMAGDARRLGIYGFGAAAHIVAQIALYEGREVYAFTRPSDAATAAMARELGARWAGGSDERAPELLDAAVLFAPVGALVPKALRDVAKGGTVVCAGIHMSDIPAFPYAILWGERRIVSVANLTRNDGQEFMALAGRIPVRTQVQGFPLEHANTALAALRNGTLERTAVLEVSTVE